MTRLLTTEQQQLEARAEFLLALQQWVPDVLLTLRNEVRPSGRPWSECTPELQRTLAQVLQATDPEAVAQEALGPAFGKLVKWSTRWNLLYLWFLEQALSTLALWEEWEHGAEILDWGLLGSAAPDVGVSDEERTIRVELLWPGHPVSREFVRAWIMAEVDKQLARVERNFEAAGYVQERPSRKRTFTDPATRRQWFTDRATRWQWFVDFHCRGASQSNLAEGHGVTQAAVSRACKQFAALLGITYAHTR